MRGGIACECMLIGFRGQPWAPRLGAVGEVARLSETAIAFACLCLCGIETAIAFACLCPCGIETTVAFAGEKWAFVVQFSGAEVMLVSAVPCWG